MLKLNYFRKKQKESTDIYLFYEDIINLIPELDKSITRKQNYRS